MPHPGSEMAGRSGERPGHTVTPPLPRIVRPAGLGRAAHPADVPYPAHHHLPGWVRRIHGQVRPILGDILGGLEGDVRERYDRQVRDFIAAISGGRFSLAWQYPRLIEDGMALYTEHRKESEAAARERRTLDAARRRVSDMIRDSAGRLSTDAASRLQRNLREAADVDAIRAVGAEVEGALSSARTLEERRRDREINRTRQRIRQAVPNAPAETQSETWQDVLRRIADQYSE